MKYLLLCFFVIAVAATPLYTNDEYKTIKQHSKECRESSHVDADKVADMRRNKHFDADDEKAKDFLFCIFKKMDWQHEDGSVGKHHVEAALARHEGAETAMHGCIDKHGSNGTETAYEIYKCWIQHLPTDFEFAQGGH